MSFRRFTDFFRMLPGNLGFILSNFPGVRAITCICIIIYILQTLASMVSIPIATGDGGVYSMPIDAFLSHKFGMYWPLFSHGAIWQPLTYAFLHGSIWHLLINLFTLIFFGYSVERLLGTKRFWAIFLISSAIGGIGWMAFDIVEPYFWQTIARLGRVGLTLAQRWGEAQGPYLFYNVCVGASGGVCGLMGAFTALCPHQRISLFLFYVIPVTMEARQMALLLVAFNLLELISSMGHVAYVAHLLGGVAGYFIARRCAKNRNYWEFYYS